MALLDPIHQAAAEEEAFFAEIRSQSRVSFHTFTRPSRSGGATHVMLLLDGSFEPIDMTHPCSCKAGAEGRICHALLDVLTTEPGVPSDKAQMARELQAARAAKSCKKGGR